MFYRVFQALVMMFVAGTVLYLFFTLATGIKI